MVSVIRNGVNILQKIEAHSSDVTCVEFWGNVLLISGSSDKTVRVWRWKSGHGFYEESWSPLLSHRYAVTSVKVSPQGGVLASASVDGTIILWDLSNGTKTNVISQENGEAIRACAFSPNSSLIVSSDDSGTVCIWGHNKTLVRLIRCHEEAVQAISFSSDSSVLLTGCALGNLRFSYIDTSGDDVVTLNSDHSDLAIDAAHDLGVLCADFCKIIHDDPSDSSTQIYTVATGGTDHLVKIWRLFCLNRLIGTTSGCKSRLLPTSPQQHMCGASTIYSNEGMNAECVMTITAHGSSVTSLKFNSAGSLLITTSLDKTVKFWDLQGNCLKTMAEHTRYVNCITINNDSTVIATGSNDRTVILWDITGKLSLDSHLSQPSKFLFSFAVDDADNIPIEFLCPITHEVMKNPVMAEDGFTYEKTALTEWFEHGKNTSPMTNMEFVNRELIENIHLRKKIDEYLNSSQFSDGNNESGNDQYIIDPSLL